MPDDSRAATQPETAESGPPARARRLARAERREQILAAATLAFGRSGFAGTSLDEIAAEAGVSRVILYRHFDSKTDLYRAVLDRVCARLIASVGTRDYTPDSVDVLVGAAAADPAGFRLLFQHAAREPEFRAEADQFRAGMVAVAGRELAGTIPDRAWAAWAAHLVPTVTIEAICAWLDAGQPDPDQAPERVRQALNGVLQAVQQPRR
jgi:AcrR family transcriptional regulator